MGLKNFTGRNFFKSGVIFLIAFSLCVFLERNGSYVKDIPILLFIISLAKIVAGLGCLAGFAFGIDSIIFALYNKSITQQAKSMKRSIDILTTNDADTGVIMALSHEELVNLIVGFGSGGSYSIMDWLDSHGYGDFYKYVGGFHDEFNWEPDKLKTLSDERLLALYKEIQQFKK